MKNKDTRNILIITILVLIFILFLTHLTNLYASTSEYITYADYFRKLFYHTWNLFPDYAPEFNQNIYELSSYGFLSPIIIISYFLPFIPMQYYLPGAIIITIIFDLILFYKLLRNHKYNSNISFLTTIIFIFSALLYNSHHNIMSITYMPFLLLGFFGINKLYKEKKSWLLTLSCFLMLMSSLTYSIPSIITLIIYSIFKYFQDKENINLKYILKNELRVIFPITIATFIAAILILPTFYVLKNSNYQLFNFSISNILYNPDGLSLTTISLLSILNFFKKHRANIFLGTILIILIPLANNLPFLPLYCLTIAELINDILKKKVKYSLILPIILIITIFVIFKISYTKLYLIDLLILLTTILIYNKTKKKNILIIIISILTITISFYYNQKDNYLSSVETNTINQNITECLETIKKNDQDYYRLSTTTNNIFETIFYGYKYNITRNISQQGYTTITNDSTYQIYQNEDILPLGFATPNTMSYEDYAKLSNPSKQEALLNIIVTDDQSNNNFITNVQKITKYNPFTEYLENDTITIQDTLEITSKLPKKYQNKIIILNFTITSNEVGYITINNIPKKITNTEDIQYIISDNNLTELIITLSKGTYKITNIELSSLDYSYIANTQSKFDLLHIDSNQTKGDTIVGDITANQNEYLVLTIPYDTGYEIKFDNKKISYEIVDTNYLGFKISEGTHHLTIQYNAPLKDISIILTILGILSFTIVTILEYQRKI